jgi:molybdenum cofactor cytidylyltransferase
MTRPAVPKVCAIVLAAGASKRFGSCKQLAMLGGETLIRRAMSAASDTLGSNFRLVLGAHAAQIVTTLELPPGHILMNPEWAEGIASSIRVGIAQVPSDCAAALLLLADQPYVTQRSLGPLIGTWRSAPEMIVASRYGLITGAPCLFPRWSFPELLRLRGDSGARTLIERHAARTLTVAHPEAAMDVDSPSELAACAANAPYLRPP